MSEWVGFQQFSSWRMDDVCVYKSVEIYAIEEKYIYIYMFFNEFSLLNL